MDLQKILNEMNAGFSDAMIFDFAHNFRYEPEDVEYAGGTIEKWLADAHGIKDEQAINALKKQLREDIANN